MKKSKKINILAIVLPVFILVVIGVIFANKNGVGNDVNSDKNVSDVTVNDNLIIPIKDISTTATFYPVEIDGTKLEVLAIKASDGTIRTAFNTCQICYSSGRGYYEQQGNMLVCQNCGNRFNSDDVEITRGGCNPVPIFSEDKTVDSENITISKEFFGKSKNIFENWKTDF